MVFSCQDLGLTILLVTSIQSIQSILLSININRIINLKYSPLSPFRR